MALFIILRIGIWVIIIGGFTERLYSKYDCFFSLDLSFPNIVEFEACNELFVGVNRLSFALFICQPLRESLKMNTWHGDGFRLFGADKYVLEFWFDLGGDGTDGTFYSYLNSLGLILLFKLLFSKFLTWNFLSGLWSLLTENDWDTTYGETMAPCLGLP